MEENKSEYQENRECKSSASGKHDWVFHTDLGEQCKHCGTVRAGEAQGKPIPSPFLVDFMGNVHDPTDLYPLDLPTAEEVAQDMANLAQRLKTTHLSDQTMNQILKETNAGSAIIITFNKPIMELPAKVEDFHIALANISQKSIRPLLDLITNVLHGRAGGVLRFRRRDDDNGQPA